MIMEEEPETSQENQGGFDPRGLGCCPTDRWHPTPAGPASGKLQCGSIVILSIADSLEPNTHTSREANRRIRGRVAIS
jgi:hypothetical protein